VRLERSALLAILLLGAGLRLLYVDTPLLDAHRWRQVDTASIARNFHENGFNVLRPQVDWGGRQGYVESELPILPALMALAYAVCGVHETLGRLIAIAFSVGAIAAIYVLARDLMGAPAGRAAAFLLAVSPSAVFYGRTVMPEAPMLFFSIAGVLGFTRYGRTGSRRALAWGAATTALACLAKLPAVVILAPILVDAWRARGRRLIADRAFVTALAAVLMAVAAWYIHALLTYRASGLTLGIFYPTQTYPISVAPGPWHPLPKWSSAQTLTDLGFYTDLIARLYFFYLTPAGFCLAAAGILLWRSSGQRRLPDVWLFAVVAFILAAGPGNRDHDYYQIPLLPAACLYFAAAAAPAFDGDFLRARIGRRWAPAAMAAVLVTVGLLGFHFSGVVRSHFRPDALDVRIRDAGAAIERQVPADALMVAVDYGVNSPMLLYFAHRKGWSFDVRHINAFTIAQLQRQGARYFATSEWAQLQAEQADAAAYLRTQRQVDLGGAPAQVVLFALK
jgi:4-amino-4-deoxy-L-arabinose transferase-like glycosyltransferase